MQAQHSQPSDPGAALRAQQGVRAVVRRALILHSAKLVALALFCAAMQLPGLLGWALTGHSLKPKPQTCWVLQTSFSGKVTLQ